MCYTFPVMLRGRCSCAFGRRVISDQRPAIRRQEKRRSLFRLFWLATRHSVLATKSNYSRLPRAPFAKGTYAPIAKSNYSRTSETFARKSNHSRTYAKTGGWWLKREPSVTSDQRSGSKTKADPSEKMTFTTEFPCHSRPGDFNRLEQERPASEGGPYTNCELPTVNCKPVFLTPAFTTTSSAIVGAPTIWFPHAIRRSQERPASEGGPYTNFELSTFDFEPPFSFFRLFLNLKLITENLKQLQAQRSQLNLDESRMRGRVRGNSATGEHASGGHAGAEEGFFAIGGRRAAHVTFHKGKAGAARASTQMRAG